MIRQKILDILACPRCKGPVRLNAEKDTIVCEACKLEYPIRDDIPIMLIDEARPIQADQES
ncbi:MAG TPA: Trm112 family protein [Desulfobulbus sp.]|nr:Trm112 family protein [Desulfobulbus sp.]